MFTFQVGQNRRRKTRAKPKPKPAAPSHDNATLGIWVSINPEHLERLAERARSDAERMLPGKADRQHGMAVVILSGLLQDWARRMADEESLPTVAQHLVNVGVRHVDWEGLARRALS